MADNIPPGTLAEIDRFIKTLVERLKMPNKSLFRQSEPVKPDDIKFKECPKAIQSMIGNVLPYRSMFGPAPPQYDELRQILEQTVPQRSPKDKYTNPKIEFAYRMRNLLLILSDPALARQNLLECKPYVRVVSLLMNDVDAKEKFKYDGLYGELAGIVRKVDKVKEDAEADKIVSAMKTAYSTDLKAKMPAVPYDTPSSLPEEPPLKFSDEDVSAAMTSPAPVSKAPLTPADNMKIAGLSSQIAKNPQVIASRLTIDQIRQIAENIYRKKSGKGRKTYRRKKHTRKTRKVRRM